IIIILIPLYVLVVSKDFLGYFEAFLGLLGIGLAAWVSIFIVDYIFLLRKQGYEPRLLEDSQYNAINVGGVVSWIIGVVVGLLLFIFSGIIFVMVVTFLFNAPLDYITIVCRKMYITSGGMVMSAQSARFKKINSSKKVLVIGSAVIDVVVTIPSIPRSGGDVFASNEEVIVGGCAYNVGNIL